MTDKQKMQADGAGGKPGADVDGQMASGGQSGGEAYPNDAPSAEEGGFIGESGRTQSEHVAAIAEAQTVEDAEEAKDRSR